MIPGRGGGIWGAVREREERGREHARVQMRMRTLQTLAGTAAWGGGIAGGRRKCPITPSPSFGHSPCSLCSCASGPWRLWGSKKPSQWRAEVTCILSPPFPTSGSSHTQPAGPLYSSFYLWREYFLYLSRSSLPEG